MLADVDRSRIYETEEDAKSNPATEIFVERAVAKVDITANLDNLAAGLPGGVKVQSIDWVLSNIEPSSYVVRNLQKVGAGFNVNSTPYWATYTSELINPKNYRFIGQAPLKDFAKYRTYFCEDPNGDGLEVANTPALTVAPNPTFLPIGVANPQYCHENTFSVENMNTFNTTCALIKVTYEDATTGRTPTFYTIGLNNTQMFTFENAARVLAVDVISNGDIQAALKKHFEEQNEAYDNNISTSNLNYSGDDAATLTANNEWMEITFSNKRVEGRLVINSLKLYDGKNGTKGDLIATFNYDDDDNTVIKDLNAVQDIKAYSNGVSYYSVLIKHFGDEYTPWNPTTLGITETTPTTQESYFTNVKGNNANPTQNFLGRYGLVRNNWYSINITKINNFGEPTYKDIHFDGTPDDKFEKEEAISCRINILSWAKRSQREEL